jgi:plastocyanin
MRRVHLRPATVAPGRILGPFASLQVMGLRRYAFLLVCALLGAAVAVLPAVAGSETAPAAITAINSEGIYKEQRHYWSPATVTVGSGAVVAFSNPSGTVMHGVEWTTGPAMPSCSGVPGGAGALSWHGECAFTAPGSYDFRCTVHPSEMTGTVTVGSTGTTTTTTTTQTTTPASGGGATSTTTTTTPAGLGQIAPLSLLAGSSSRALRLAGSQRGRSVRGSLEVSRAGSGGRLEVDLLARSASLAAARDAGQLRIGRFVRSAVRAGAVPFKVSLSARAVHALRARHRLALTVRIRLAAPHGPSLQLSRTVVLHA